MDKINIPPQAGMALAKEMRRQCGIAISPMTAYAAICAMLTAWPGMRMMVDIDTGDDAAIKLPLNTENPDADA